MPRIKLTKNKDWKKNLPKKPKTEITKSSKANPVAFDDSKLSIYDPEKAASIIDQIERGVNRFDAARAANISINTFYQWMNTRAGFREKVYQADSLAVSQVGNALFQRAATGDVAAIKMFLNGKRASLWAEKTQGMQQAIQVNSNTESTTVNLINFLVGEPEETPESVDTVLSPADDFQKVYALDDPNIIPAEFREIIEPTDGNEDEEDEQS
jgi:hypothetical protein